MFIHSRFVIVDDKETHLDGIKKSLDSLRLDCHSKLYSDETVADWQKLPGMRILFLDQNLITGATFGSETKDELLRPSLTWSLNLFVPRAVLMA